MTARQALSRFADDLHRLRRLAGSPSLNQLVALTAGLEYPLARSTISDKLNAKSLVEWDFVVSFVAACRAHGKRAGADLPAEATELGHWDLAHRTMLTEVDDGKTEARLRGMAQRQLLLRHGGPVPVAAPAGWPGPVPQPPSGAPRQLPAATRAFVGRQRERATIAALADEVTSAGAGPRVLAIDGMAGVGKTALAVSTAHALADRFPAGQLWLDLHGFGPLGPPVSATDALAGLLDGLGVPAAELPVGLAARAARFRSRVAGGGLLIVLDNARDCAQVRPLLPGTGGCLVLVTSRLRLTGLASSDGAELLSLRPPDEAEARDLLTRRLARTTLPAEHQPAEHQPAGHVPAEPEPAAVAEVVARCARLPLALSVVAARAGQPTPTLSALAAELRDRRTVLDSLDGGDPASDVRTVFSSSVAQLGGAARSLFLLLAGYPGPTFEVPAAASLIGEPVRVAARALAELCTANLVSQPTPGQYTVHELLRAYGAELAGEPGRQPVAVQRLRDYYLHSAYAAARVLDRHRQTIELPTPPPDVVAEVFDGYAPALRWLTAAVPALLAAVAESAAAGLDAYAWQLGWTLTTFLDRHGRWDDLITVQQTALTASRRLGCQLGQALSHGGLGRGYLMVGRYPEARQQLRRALRLFQLGTRPAGVSCAYFDLAILAERQGRHLVALHQANQALQLYQRLAHPTGPARALAVVSRLQGRLGDVARAVQGCEQAIEVQQRIGDRRGEAASWASLGVLWAGAGRRPEAAACHANAARLNAELGDRHCDVLGLALPTRAIGPRR